MFRNEKSKIYGTDISQRYGIALANVNTVCGMFGR